jgi:hypothetical protein
MNDDFVLTDEEMLRAVAFTEAAWSEDHAALATLGAGQPGEKQIGVVVAGLGDAVIMMTVMSALGLDPLDEEQAQAAADAMSADMTVRLAKLLATSLKEWAADTDVSGAQRMARILVSYLQALTDDGEPRDALEVLAAIRRQLLSAG